MRRTNNVEAQITALIFACSAVFFTAKLIQNTPPLNELLPWHQQDSTAQR